MKKTGDFLKDKPEYEDYSDNIMGSFSCCSSSNESKGCCCGGGTKGKGCCQRLELKVK